MTTTAEEPNAWLYGRWTRRVLNSYGGFDYVMTQTHNAGYLANYTPEQRAYFDSYPMWMEAVWAIGVWGGLLGALLLLLRRRLAFPVFAASLAAFLVSLVYSYALSDGSKIMGSMGTIMNAVITLVAIGEVLYARPCAARRPALVPPRCVRLPGALPV